MFLLTNKRGFSILEFLIICCIIFILIGTFGIYANRILKEARESALRYELAGFRQHIKLFNILHRRNPGSIYEFFGDDDKLVDPFGHVYIYNPIEGEIRSSSSGYENW